MKTNFYNHGQSLIGIIIVLVMVGLISGGLYYYLSKQIPEVPEITGKPAEKVTSPPEKEGPTEEKPTLPENKVTPTPEPEKPIIKKCADGTIYGQCSTNKPKYCENGTLVNKCSICSCPLNQYCDKLSGLCKVLEKLDMLIFISPQYANDTQIKQAIDEYINAVKNDVGYDTKIITITSDINDFRKIDEIIEDYYNKSGGGLKAGIMVGEDINTALYSEGEDTAIVINHESPSITPWATLEKYSTIKNNKVVVNDPKRIDVAISLLYPTHELDYQIRSQQIVGAFEKFSKNRNKVYPNKSLAFLYSEPGYPYPSQIEDYKTLSNYSDLYYKESPTRNEVLDSLKEHYMIYSVDGHATPGIIQLSSLSSPTWFFPDDLESLDVPLFMGSGCNVMGWWGNNPKNDKLDYSINQPWFGSKIFTNPYLRIEVLGEASQVCMSQSNLDFFGQVIPDLMTGKTLAESLIGDDLCNPANVTIYGDPTFHYNF